LKNLLALIFQWSPEQRISLLDALLHPFFASHEDIDALLISPELKHSLAISSLEYDANKSKPLAPIPNMSTKLLKLQTKEQDCICVNENEIVTTFQNKKFAIRVQKNREHVLIEMPKENKTHSKKYLLQELPAKYRSFYLYMHQVSMKPRSAKPSKARATKNRFTRPVSTTPCPHSLPTSNYPTPTDISPHLDLYN